jgi:hypothetical protein
MMRFDGKQVADEFEEAFQRPLSSISPRMAWWLVKLIKHCRMRCRNNSALNNYLNRNFKGLRFQQVTKTRQDGSTYPGLEITGKDGALMYTEDEE